MFPNAWNWENQWRERIPDWWEHIPNRREQILRLEKWNSDENSGVEKAQNRNNRRIPKNSEWNFQTKQLCTTLYNYVKLCKMVECTSVSSWLGNPVGIPWNSAVIPIPNIFTPRIFHQNFMFLIKNFVPTNSEHVPASSIYFPTINFSNFMHQKKIPQFFIFLAKLTSTCFLSTTSRCYFGWKWFWGCFLWNRTWCKCANHATTFWCRLQNLSNYIPCPCHTYELFEHLLRL